jgi:hypothetical protein
MNEKSKKAVDFAGFPDAGIANLESEGTQQTAQPRTPKRQPQSPPKPVSGQQSERLVPPPTSSSSEGKNIWLWVLAGCIIFVIWAANQDGGSGRTTGSSSTTYSPPTYTPPSTSRRESTPSLPTLSVPPVGTYHVHSAAEIRYCLAADIRIEALRPHMTTNTQIDAFNGIISDYNSRCGNYRYREGTIERARRDIEPYRSAIVANAWDGISLSAKPAQQQRSTVQRSQLTMDIQKALSALGYNPGAADGIFGRKTKAAIEAFQRDYSMPVTGQESSELLRQLRRVLELKENYQSSMKRWPDPSNHT